MHKPLKVPWMDYFFNFILEHDTFLSVVVVVLVKVTMFAHVCIARYQYLLRGWDEVGVEYLFQDPPLIKI